MSSVLDLFAKSVPDRPTLGFLVFQIYVYFALGQLKFHSFPEPRRFNPRIRRYISRSCIPPSADCGIWSSSLITNPELPPYSEQPIPDSESAHSLFEMINFEQTGILLLATVFGS